MTYFQQRRVNIFNHVWMAQGHCYRDLLYSISCPLLFCFPPSCQVLDTMRSALISYPSISLLVLSNPPISNLEFLICHGIQITGN